MNIFSNSDEAGGGRIPARNEVPVADTWDPSVLYASDEAWSADFAELQTLWPAIAGFKGRVVESALTLLEVLEFEKALNLKIERLSHYAMLRISEDASSAANLEREGLLQNLLTSIGEATAFILPEIQALDDATFER